MDAARPPDVEKPVYWRQHEALCSNRRHSADLIDQLRTGISAVSLRRGYGSLANYSRSHGSTFPLAERATLAVGSSSYPHAPSPAPDPADRNTPANLRSRIGCLGRANQGDTGGMDRGRPGYLCAADGPG